MATGTLTPSPYQTVSDANGKPVSGSLIYTYLAGTTTPTPTYTEVTLTTANSNPIVADSSGRYVAFLSPGQSYKFVIQYSTGTAIRTQDNISAVPPTSSNLDITGVAGEAITAGEGIYLSDGSGSKAAGSWFAWDSANTYSSTLPQIGFSLANTASGATLSIRKDGTMTGLSSLTVGSTYYVGTAGALTSTPPTNARIVGSADTTSTLVMGPALPAPAIPRCRVYSSVFQSIPDSVFTALTWDSESYDVGGLHSTTTNPSRITIPANQDGTYALSADCDFTNVPSGYRAVLLSVNGTTGRASTSLPAVSGNNTVMGVYTEVVLAAGDYVEVLVYQTSGAALNVGTTSDDYHWFTARRVA